MSATAAVTRGLCANLKSSSLQTLSVRRVSLAPALRLFSTRKTKIANRDFSMAATAASFFDFSATSPAEGPGKIGSEVSLSKYAGKVVLVVNIATL